MHYIYGINAVAEALKARGRTFSWVAVAKERSDIRLKRIIEDCRKVGVPVKVLPRTELDEMAGTGAHQGVVAVTSSKQYTNLEDVIVAKRSEHSLIVVLDGVEDPHNLGAILRTADAAGADGVVIPERRAAGVTGTVTKVSAGASEHLPIARVTNIARSLEELKDSNIWTVGLDERGSRPTTRWITRWTARSFWGRREGIARSGGEEMRLSGFDPDARQGAVAQCFGSGRRGSLRGCSTESERLKFPP